MDVPDGEALRKSPVQTSDQHIKSEFKFHLPGGAINETAQLELVYYAKEPDFTISDAEWYRVTVATPARTSNVVVSTQKISPEYFITLGWV